MLPGQITLFRTPQISDSYIADIITDLTSLGGDVLVLLTLGQPDATYAYNLEC